MPVADRARQPPEPAAVALAEAARTARAVTDWLTRPEQPALSPEIEATLAAARELADASRSDNTRESYRSGWDQFLRYCREQHPGRTPLPAHPALVALFLTWLNQNGRTPATLRSRAAAIGYYHRRMEHPSPTDHQYVKDVLEGAARRHAGRDHGRATVTREDLEALLLRLPEPSTPLEIRDRAIALLTFATSRRRSEIAALDLAHLTFRRQNEHDFLFVRIAKSKTDQHGVGMTVAVPRLGEPLARVCAVAALEQWLDALGARDGHTVVGEGPLFRAFSIQGELQAHRIEPRAVAAVLKRLYAQAGYGEEHIRAIAAHSLRRGFITSADAAGATAAEIMAVSGHRDRRMLDRYTNHEKTKNPPLLRMFGSGESSA